MLVRFPQRLKAAMVVESCGRPEGRPFQGQYFNQSFCFEVRVPLNISWLAVGYVLASNASKFTLRPCSRMVA